MVVPLAVICQTYTSVSRQAGQANGLYTFRHTQLIMNKLRKYVLMAVILFIFALKALFETQLK